MHCIRTISIALALALGLGLAACGSSEADDTGAPCSSTMLCKDGFVCDLTDPAGSDCIAADGDLDGDGIDNAHDFCDHMPGGQYDEDGDGIGDICDKCPIAAPPATPDTDNDGVDSPCDPYPDTDGDQIFLFDGFNGTFGSNWTPSPATAWQIEGGELVVTQGSDGDALMTIPMPLPSNRFALESSYRVDLVPADNGFHTIAVIGDAPLPAGETDFSCTAERTSTGDSLQLATTQASGNSTQMNLFDTAGLYRLVGRQDGGNAGCVLIGDVTPGAVQATINPTQMTQVQLSAHDVTARFEYILIVGH